MWTEEQKQFVIDNLNLMSDRELSLVLDKKIGCVSSFRKRKGLKRSINIRKHPNQKGKNNYNWKGGVSKNNMRYKRRSKFTHPKEDRARGIARRALNKGTLIPQPCEKCGKLEVQMHHDDYDKPLDVRWLCPEHHSEEHGGLCTGVPLKIHARPIDVD